PEASPTPLQRCANGRSLVSGSRGGGRMQYGVKCECGWSAQGTEDELVQLTQQHGREVHKLEVTPEQARAQFRPIGGWAAEGLVSVAADGSSVTLSCPR